MNQEIKYNGLSVVPSDYECQDGTLAVALNLIPEDGALQPVFPPKTEVELSSEVGRCVFIHKTSDFTHYIVVKDNLYSWFNKNSSNVITSIGAIVDCSKVTSIGNTLIFLTNSGMKYYLWKGETQGYLYLGSKLPECPISFGLQGEMTRTDEFTINFDRLSDEDLWKTFSDENKKKISEQVLARVNKFIAEEGTKKGRFMYPFFVRYAYRLYDGSLTMHSAPILMVASSDIAPQVFWNTIYNKNTSATLRVVAMLHKLDYAVIDQSYINTLSNWKDIVRSIDIFCSKPIYTYDQNGLCKRFTRYEEFPSHSVCKHINQAASTETYPLRYQRHTLEKLYAFTYHPSDLVCPGGRLILPRRSTDAVKEDIRSVSQFYFLESIKVGELSSTRTIIEIEDDYLQSLVNREVMTDDYDSHDTLIPKYAFSYNSRLNLANLKKTLFGGYNTGAQFCYTDGFVQNYSSTSPTINDRKASYAVFVFIRQNGRVIIVKSEPCALALTDAPLLFIYYPNVNAYKAIVVRTDYTNIAYFEVTLEQHAFLNGAFYFGGWYNPNRSYHDSIVESGMETRTVDILNKIYTSEVNNPFYFPLLGINTVGTGEIIGISSAAKALSQGQFGQFPLYAFSTDGVWALEVSSTGGYSAKQPITRDVCINPEGITQLDSAVIFPTDRGLMLISGAQTTCISDVINSEYPFDVLSLPKFEQLHRLLGSNHSNDKCLHTLPFSKFLKECRMIYDYVHQRVIVYAPKIEYAYIYSLKTQQWGMTHSKIVSHLNAYPNALAVDDHNNIVNFSTSDEKQVKGLYLTRPVKLEMPNVLKTIDTIIQRGVFRKGSVSTVLYGSRDLINWHLVWTSRDHYLRGFRGTPYKYFRIGGVATLGTNENIFGASVQFSPRQNNQPR